MVPGCGVARLWWCQAVVVADLLVPRRGGARLLWCQAVEVRGGARQWFGQAVVWPGCCGARP